jgi:hypothetical protein
MWTTRNLKLSTCCTTARSMRMGPWLGHPFPIVHNYLLYFDHVEGEVVGVLVGIGFVVPSSCLSWCAWTMLVCWWCVVQLSTWKWKCDRCGVTSERVGVCRGVTWYIGFLAVVHFNIDHVTTWRIQCLIKKSHKYMYQWQIAPSTIPTLLNNI